MKFALSNNKRYLTPLVDSLAILLLVKELFYRAYLTPFVDSLDDYIDNYYNVARTHMSLNKDSPIPRPV
jgi:hypothetical protein